MDFNLSDDQQMFYDTVRRFAEKELAADAAKRAMQPQFPHDIARRAAELGLIGITFDEKDGGAGGSLIEAILAIQGVALSCPRSADVVQAGNFGPIRTFYEYATPAQKEKYLKPLMTGDAVISLGMSEPGAGSAVTELTTSAVQDGDHYIINGTKVFGTHSPEADLYLIYVRFGPGTGGIGSVLIEKGTPGLIVGKPTSFMNGEQWAQVYFEDCRIHKDDVLLGPGGFKKQISGFNVERLGNSSRAVSVGRHAFNVAREHALTRKQFGRALCEFQGLQWKFAEMELRLTSAQLMLMRAAANAKDGLPSAQDTALAKLACNEAGWFAANEALQIMGGLGFSEDSTVQYCLRRTRGWMIAGGSTEILKNRIAEGIFERRFAQRAPEATAAG
ncbi:acyl-CoA dehydrogenase family protein [Pseudooceanicola sp.]|uniref:acyl-CoA dehydrogenase family protein n=1 Tax=Pseudooceanicola sp. TaxID=1914328 RepID=UPI00261F1B0F|nr:acyl-CoA dehydrogenase family protein [Pseudooceanicola sp.]MDF1855040.1 acyl-CoA dehydrogenase family protein [Pseudooceanicola sp.]